MISWKKIALLGLCLSLALQHARSAESAGGAASTGPAPATTGHRLRHLLIGESAQAVQTLTPATDATFVSVSPALASFDVADLTRRLAVGQNRVIEERLLAAIAQVIENFFRLHEYPTAAAIVPTQSIATGDVRIIVVLGVRAKSIGATEWKIRKINIQNTRWFSESLLREKLRIEQGETIRFSDLDQAINWTNNNPYRRVQVKLDPVPNTTEADLTIAVQETIPLRFAASYSNSGNEAIGKSQYTASIGYGNLWGKDHQISYQYITGDQPKFFQGHGLDYRIPLPWRHNLQFSASYLQAKPEFFEGLFVQKGETWTGDMRYTIPVRTGENSVEAYADLNFKESNNNLAYGGTQVLGTKTDVFQLTIGGSMVKRDSRGGWAFGGSITGSPGGINGRNTDRAFDAGRFGSGDSARAGATARYFYGNLSLQRLLTLAPGWDYNIRGIFQASQANLLPSEELTIGGSTTVRGYPEGVSTGDHGFVLTNELTGPAWRLALPKISKTRGPLETRPLVFLDVANVGAHESFAADPARFTLAGAGVGLRMSLGTNFSLTADYGWQLSHIPLDQSHASRGHIKATLAF